VNASELGTVQRPDGTYQVTYFCDPLYEFIRDASMPAGAVSGENVTAFNAFWHLDTIPGLPAPGAARVILENTAQGPVLATPTAFGTYRSLYALTFDPPDATTCTGPCTGIWPPLLTTREPAAGSGVNRDALGILQRPDGTRQVTYFGHPVYLFAFDLAAGAPSGPTNGEYLVDQFQHGVWWLLAPNGIADPDPLSIASMPSAERTVLAVDPPSPFAFRTFAVYAFSADSATASACTGTLRPLLAPGAGHRHPGRRRRLRGEPSRAGHDHPPGRHIPGHLLRPPTVLLLLRSAGRDVWGRHRRLRRHLQRRRSFRNAPVTTQGSPDAPLAWQYRPVPLQNSIHGP